MDPNVQEHIKCETIYVEDTQMSADSVEWCPNAPCENVLVCANYHFDTETDANNPIRVGKIRLYVLNKECKTLTLRQIIDDKPVLDQKWCRNDHEISYLGVVTATDELEIYKLDNDLIELQFITSHSFNRKDTFLLSLDWNTGKDNSLNPNIIVSDSKGEITLFEFANNTLTVKHNFKAHTFEAWITSFYSWNPSILFSGGDDSKFLQFDLRNITYAPVFDSKKAYSAGVTSIHSNIEKEYIVAVGSYDTKLKMWDLRNMKNELSTLTMPDSVWRAKWNPNDTNLLLTACMRQGFYIIDATDIKAPKILWKYNEHTGIAYGCDWKYTAEDALADFYSEIYYIGACSFTDNKLSVAKFSLNLYD